MPRTKVTKSVFTPLATNRRELLEEIRKSMAIKKRAAETVAQDSLANLENAYCSLLAEYSEAELSKTIGQIRKEQRELSQKQLLLKAPSANHNSAERSGSSHKDEGYLTEATSTITPPNVHVEPASAVKTLKSGSRRLSRSLSRSNVKTIGSNSSTLSSNSMAPPSTAYRGQKRTRRSSSTSALGRPQYRTPCNKRMVNFPPITPKVAPNTPLTLLRQPRQGEMVMSLSGSPLLPGNGPSVAKIANCNIPLEDGTVLSLAPHKLRKSQFQVPAQYLGPDMYQQLATLRNNLDLVCKMVENRN